MPVILITGAGSGLGLAFLEHYAQDPSNIIFAIDRTWPEPLPDSFHKSQVHQQTVDVTSEAHLEALVFELYHQIRTLTKEGHPKIDLVIHSAGIRGLVPVVPIRESSDVAKAETLQVMDVATLMKAFEVNVAGTFSLVRSMLPLLQHRRGWLAPDFSSIKVSKVVIMGSRMASISSNTGGGGYAYRASKAALNAIVKSLPLDVPDVCFVVAHPGRVATKLCDGVREDNAMEADEVLPGIVQLIEGWSLKDSGRFVDRFGNDIGW